MQGNLEADVENCGRAIALHQIQGGTMGDLTFPEMYTPSDFSNLFTSGFPKMIVLHHRRPQHPKKLTGTRLLSFHASS